MLLFAEKLSQSCFASPRPEPPLARRAGLRELFRGGLTFPLFPGDPPCTPTHTRVHPVSCTHTLSGEPGFGVRVRTRARAPKIETNLFSFN